MTHPATPDHSANRQNLPGIAWFTVMSMVSPVALNILMPALPDIATDLNVSTDEVQLSLTLYLLTLAFGQLICGPLADRFGRKPVLLTGIALHFVGCLLGAFADDLQSLLIARVLQAAGGCTGMVLARTIMLDCYSRSQAAGKIGYITLSIALAQAIAPTLGGQLNLLFGWQVLFHFSLLLSSASWLIVLLVIPETAIKLTTSIRLSTVLQRYQQLICNRSYLRYSTSATLIACGFYLFIGTAPYIVASQMQGSSADFGNWFLLVALGFMAGSFTAARLSANLGISRMIFLGNAVSGCAALGLLTALLITSLSATTLSYALLFLTMAFYTYGRGLSQPNNQSAAIASSTVAPGAASGLLGFMQLITGALVTQVAPLVLEMGTEWLAVMLVIFVAGAILLSQKNYVDS